MFFRTNDTRRDRSIIDSAKQQRRQQLQAQQQLQEAHRAAMVDAPAMAVPE